MRASSIQMLVSTQSTILCMKHQNFAILCHCLNCIPKGLTFPSLAQTDLLPLPFYYPWRLKANTARMIAKRRFGALKLNTEVKCSSIYSKVATLLDGDKNLLDKGVGRKLNVPYWPRKNPIPDFRGWLGQRTARLALLHLHRLLTISDLYTWGYTLATMGKTGLCTVYPQPGSTLDTILKTSI